MSVTIDSLQIEIQSNSAGAAQGIDALATSLEKLKSSGKVTTAVNNLKKLSGALKDFTVGTKAAAEIRELKSAMDGLKSVGSVGSIGKNLKTLSDGMKSIGNLSLNGIAPKIVAIASAVKPLSAIKSGGLKSMADGMLKIGKATNSLDKGTITRFAAKVKELNNILGPLSTKMTSISSGFKAINSNAKRAATGVSNFNKKIHTGSLNASSFIIAVQGIASALQPVINYLTEAVSQAIEWDGVAARFGRGFGGQASETYEWIKRLNEEMGINIQQFMQYSSIYATMLTGFGVAQEDASKMALGYTELTYDIWAGYNDIYKTFDEAAEAVRSAIAGEVEPVRRAGFTIIESTLEQTAANHGLEISLENATEAQKSYLRYLTLVDQAHAQNLVGTYAKELNTAEGLMRTFSQQVKSLAQSLGSLFLPILVKVVPWLQAFISLLTEAVHAVAAFFGIEIQKVDWGGASGGLGDIGSSADNAAGSVGNIGDQADQTTQALKELKNATLGIDELNVISPSSASDVGSGAGGAGGGSGSGSPWGDIDSLWDESIFDSIQSKVDDIKGEVLDFFREWETEIKIISGLLAALGMTKMLTHLGQALGLGDKFLALMGKISKLAVTGIIITLQYSLMTEMFDSYIDSKEFKDYIMALFVGAISTYVLYSMWGATGLVIGLTVTAVASLKAVIDNGGINSTESAVVALTGLASAIGAVGIAIKKLAPIIKNSNLGAFLSLLKEGNGFLPTLSAAFPKLSAAISKAAGSVGTFLTGISAPMWAAIVVVILEVVAVIIFLKENWDEVTAATKRFFNENIAPKLKEIKEHFAKLKETLGPLIEALDWLIEPIKEVIKSFVEWWKSVGWLEGLGKIFEALGGVVFTVLTGQIAGSISMVVQFIEGLVQTITGLVEIVSGVIKAIVRLCQGDLHGALDACKEIGQGIVDVFVGLYDATVGPVVSFVEGIIDWFVKLWDELVGHSIVPDTIDGIVDCFLSLPGRILGFVGKFAGDIIGKFTGFGKGITEKISSGWDQVKNWWRGKADLDSAKVGVSLFKNGWSTIKGWIGAIPGVSQAVDLAKSGWSSVKHWVGSIPKLSQGIGLAKSGWSSVTKWVGSIPKLSQKIGLLKNGWSSVSKWIGSMPSLSAKIKLAKSGWSSIKNWLGDLSYKLKFTMPKIGVNWGTKEVMGFKIKYPSGFYTYAKGGFPDMGEMFIAREAGPEMVGKIGSKTTVANNEQIVEAISDGVYSAVTAAMRSSGDGSGDRPINLYLDGRQILATVERHRRERGASIMGNQVYSHG